MKAMVLTAPNAPFQLTEVPDPIAGEGEAVAKVLTCGAGLTIQHQRAGRIKIKYPRINGHEITAEIVETGTDSADLKVGDPVQVDGPYGVSYLRESHSGPIIALAGSTGLAPIKCIVQSALRKGMKQGIYLYFGVRTPRDLYLEEELKGLSDMHSNLTFVPVMSETSGGRAYRSGLVSDAVVSDFGDLDGCKSYIAGPPKMVEDAVQKFELLGMRREDCHADAFYTEADKAKLDTVKQ